MLKGVLSVCRKVPLSMRSCGSHRAKLVAGLPSSLSKRWLADMTWFTPRTWVGVRVGVRVKRIKGSGEGEG